RSANRATATNGAADPLSGTNPSHGKAHSATDRPNRSDAPRPRPGSTNAESAGVSLRRLLRNPVIRAWPGGADRGRRAAFGPLTDEQRALVIATSRAYEAAVSAE